MRLLFVAVSLLAFLSSATADQDFPEGPVISTTRGQVRGAVSTIDGKQVNAFLAIPYATPPFGELRFRKPQPAQPWPGVLDGTQWGPACPQHENTTGLPSYLLVHPGATEDCLHLNVWIPNSGASSYPVMVYLHGGGLHVGGNNVPLYNGAALAALNDVIVVVPNYRLGILGLLDIGVPEQAAGNVALYDQQLALTWIIDNAATLKADPERVTLFGESAGSLAVSLHMLNPDSSKFFTRAIMESAAPMPSLFDSVELSLKKTEAVAKVAGCLSPDGSIEAKKAEVIRCLRKKDAAKLIKAQNTVSPSILYMPTYPNYFLPRYPLETLREGDLKKTELLIGYTKEEGAFIIYYFQQSLRGKLLEDVSWTTEQVKDIFNKMAPFWGVNASFVPDSFWNKEGSSPLRQLFEITGDLVTTCPTLRFALAAAQAQDDVYVYEFSLKNSKSMFGKTFRTTHLDDIPMVFGRPFLEPDEYSDDDREYSRQIMAIWSHFAKHGNPGTVNGIKWEKYNEQHQRLMRLEPGNTEMVTDIRKDICKHF